MYTVVRYKYTSCVDAQVTRKSLYIGAVAQYKVCKMIEISLLNFPILSLSISCFGRPNTFPSSRTTALYWNVLWVASSAVFGKRLKIY